MRATITDALYQDLTDNTVQMLETDFITTDGGARMTYARIRVVEGVLEYSFTHNPNVDPVAGTAQDGACFLLTPVDDFTEIWGYENLANLRFKRKDGVSTQFYIAVGYGSC